MLFCRKQLGRSLTVQTWNNGRRNIWTDRSLFGCYHSLRKRTNWLRARIWRVFMWSQRSNVSKKQLTKQKWSNIIVIIADFESKKFLFIINFPAIFYLPVPLAVQTFIPCAKLNVLTVNHHFNREVVAFTQQKLEGFLMCLFSVLCHDSWWGGWGRTQMQA